MKAIFLQRLQEFCSQIAKESIKLYWSILKLTVPIIVAIELLNHYFDFSQHIAKLLSPVMSFVGVPNELAIVWVTAIFLHIYGAIIILYQIWGQIDITTAQMTVLATMILICHAIPVECRITQRAGLPLLSAIGFRLLGAIALGWILHKIYDTTGILTEPISKLQLTDATAAESLGEIFISLGVNYLTVFLIIVAICFTLKLFKLIGLELLLQKLLMPLMHPLGISKRATTTTTVGMLLGITYGGAFLIKEHDKKTMSPAESKRALALLCLCHAIIEDTLLMIAIGADVTGVLFARVIFTVIVIWCYYQFQILTKTNTGYYAGTQESTPAEVKTPTGDH